ncbi:MAG: metallophosphoesterase family protein [Planctomycetota bacterium]
MRIGILGDVHSNLEALTVVIDRLRTTGVEHWVQVGDIVGYGADPVACIEILRELRCTVCLGNHDAAVVGFIPTEYFNHFARKAIEWTRDQLRPTDLEYLRGLPLKVEHPHYTVVHGSLHLPEQFGYVFSPVEAADSIAKQRTKVAFVGHSHIPAVYLHHTGGAPRDIQCVYESEFEVDISKFDRALVNVGSVGQPRDEDPRAAYCVYDSDTHLVRVSRVDYDIATTQQKIRQAGLPAVLADRLSLGV